MRTLIALAGGSLLLGSGAYVTGAFDRGDYYAIAPRAAEALLQDIRIGPDLVAYNDNYGKIRVMLRRHSPRALNWDIIIDGEKAGIVNVALAPEGTGTRVKVDIDFGEGGGIIDKGDDRFLHDMAEVTMIERVDATLDGRFFDYNNVAFQLAGRVATDPQAITVHQQKVFEQIEQDMMRTGLPSDVRNPNLKIKSGRDDPADSHADGGWGKKK